MNRLEMQFVMVPVWKEKYSWITLLIFDILETVYHWIHVDAPWLVNGWLAATDSLMAVCQMTLNMVWYGNVAN